MNTQVFGNIVYQKLTGPDTPEQGSDFGREARVLARAILQQQSNVAIIEDASEMRAVSREFAAAMQQELNSLPQDTTDYFMVISDALTRIITRSVTPKAGTNLHIVKSDQELDDKLKEQGFEVGNMRLLLELSL